MKEFALLFRMDITTAEKQPSAAQIEVYMRQWMEWVQEIEAGGQLAPGGNHFSPQGKVLLPGDSMMDGPYVAEGLSVAGYLLVYAKDMDGAVAIGGKCPILAGEGTSVEVRETATPGR